MKKLIIAMLLFQSLALAAQMASLNRPRSLITELALAEPGDLISLPEEYFDYSADNPSGQMQRGALLYAAAGRASELKHTDRALELATSSKNWLAEALPGLGSKPALQSQCRYYLGLLSERYDGDLATAEQHLRQAVAINPGNTQAAQALTRVQFARNPSIRR